jgi:hypothetical protein
MQNLKSSTDECEEIRTLKKIMNQKERWGFLSKRKSDSINKCYANIIQHFGTKKEYKGFIRYG